MLIPHNRRRCRLVLGLVGQGEILEHCCTSVASSRILDTECEKGSSITAVMAHCVLRSRQKLYAFALLGGFVPDAGSKPRWFAAMPINGRGWKHLLFAKAEQEVLDFLSGL